MATRILLLLFILTTGIVSGLFAQTEEKELSGQSLYWIRYYNKIDLGKGYRLNTEIENRRFFTHNRQHQWVLPRITLTKKLGDGWSAGIGFTYFLQSLPHDGGSEIDITVPELRPHQEISYRQNIKNISLTHRYKLEERFFHKVYQSELATGYNFNFRFRYRLQLSIPIIKKETGRGNFNFTVFDEIMLNFGNQIVRNTFDQNRFGIGVNYAISDHLELQLNGINWFQQRTDGDKYYNRNIVRLTVYHSIKLKDTFTKTI